MLKDQIATFEKVSFEQFKQDTSSCMYNEAYCREIYDNIKLPSRATSGSVGYDFYLPSDLILLPGQAVIIPTGIRCKMEEGYSLDIYPKSGLGFKFFTTIANTVGIIDADYYGSDNEGHIMVKIINQGFNIDTAVSGSTIKTLERKAGESFVQGIFHECFGATNDNDNNEMKIRNGGFDSTR